LRGLRPQDFQQTRTFYRTGALEFFLCHQDFALKTTEPRNYGSQAAIKGKPEKPASRNDLDREERQVDDAGPLLKIHG
jgi:hypothetical protein